MSVSSGIGQGQQWWVGTPFPPASCLGPPVCPQLAKSKHQKEELPITTLNSWNSWDSKGNIVKEEGEGPIHYCCLSLVPSVATFCNWSGAGVVLVFPLPPGQLGTWGQPADHPFITCSLLDPIGVQCQCRDPAIP